MTDEQQPTAGVQPVPVGTKSGGNPLGFSLEFREQTALVGFSDRRLGAGLTPLLHVDRVGLGSPPPARSTARPPEPQLRRSVREVSPYE